MVLKDALVEAEPLRETLVLTESLKDCDKLCDFTSLNDALVEADSLRETLVLTESLKD